MNKGHLFHWVLFVFLIGGTENCFSQKIENVYSEISESTINIFYDLLGIADDQPVIIRVFVSTDGGLSYGSPLKSVNGDIGVVIGSGERKRITWNVFEEFDELVSESVKFKVKADLLQSDKERKLVEPGFLFNVNANLGSKVDLGSYGFNLKFAIYLKQLGLGVRGGYYQTFGEVPDNAGFDYYTGFSGGALVEYDFIRDPKFSVYPFFYIGQTKISQKDISNTNDYSGYSIFYSPGLGMDVRIAKFIYLGVEFEYYMAPVVDIDDQAGSSVVDRIVMDGFCAGIIVKFFLQPGK